MSGKFLLIYICNFHVLSHLLLIYICKLYWNPNKGMYTEAVVKYNELIEKEREKINEGGNVNANIHFWSERNLECLYNLLEWKQLNEKLEELTMSGSEDYLMTGSTFTERLIMNQKCRETYLPKHLSCITHSHKIGVESIHPFLDVYSSAGETIGASNKVIFL